MTTYADLKPGDTIGHHTIPGIFTVVSVTPTGSVKFGESGPGATPVLEVVVTGMPKPFAGRIRVAADQQVEAPR